MAAELPTYRINLALPPRERYKVVAEHFTTEVRQISALFLDVLSFLIPARPLLRLVSSLSFLLLRRVYSPEQTDEIRGIADVTGVPLYQLIALNVFLDALCGCSSGTVPVLPQPGSGRSGGSGGEVRLMHFRTLDWRMDELRDLLVKFQYVDTAGGEEVVVAESVSYVGFTGMLTGVRRGLSVSMNYRPVHECSRWKRSWHALMVVLGRREAIPSILRSVILPAARSSPGAGREKPPSFKDEVEDLASRKMASCYLILSSGKESSVIEKDLDGGLVRFSEDFIVHTNHDVHREMAQKAGAAGDAGDGSTVPKSRGEIKLVEGWLEDSVDRYELVEKRWRRIAAGAGGAKPRGGSLRRRRTRGKVSTLDGPRGAESCAAAQGGDLDVPAVEEKTLWFEWLRHKPTTNECTHFRCVMDPTYGNIRWVEKIEVDSSDEES